MKQIKMRCATIAGLALTAAMATAQQVQVTVNGTPVQFDAAQPEMLNGRVLVPFRGVFEQMGVSVSWDASTQTIMADGDGRHVRLQLGSYDASVNGRVVTMDVQPQMMNDTTMVPLRFLSQALGGHVDWQPQNNLVAITVPPHEAAQRIVNAPPAPPPPPPPTPTTVIIEKVIPPAPPPASAPTTPPSPVPPFIVHRDVVIPLRLDQDLSSEHNHAGDRVSATIRDSAARYMEFPDGTVLEGSVRSATEASGSHGGSLDVRFTHIRFPDGARYEVRGLVTKLEDSHIVRTDDGSFVAKVDISGYMARDTAVGAGAGLYLGSLNGKPVGGAVIGGSLGAIVGAFDHSMAHNVIIPAGAHLGLILDHELRIDHIDLR